MSKVNNWSKFKLLVWKNWVLQWNRKVQFLFELILPVIFSLLLVLIRTLVDVEIKGEVKFDGLDLLNLQSLRSPNGIGNISIPKFELYYSPQNEFLGRIVDEAVFKLSLKNSTGFENAFALEQALVANNILAGVQFDDSLAGIKNFPDSLSFALRFPSELRTKFTMNWMTKKLFPIFDMSGPRNPDDLDGGVPVGYVREGFLPIQHALTTSYIELTSGQNIPSIYLQRYPYPAYIFDPLIEPIGAFMPMIILLSFIYPCINLTRNITTEKEKQLKEVMKIMGLNNWLHWTAWFVQGFIILGMASIMIVLLMKIKWSSDDAVLTQSSYTVVLLFMLVYSISSICFCFMMATCFSRASTAAAVTGLVFFIAYLPFSFSINDYGNVSLQSKLGWSLFSNSAMGFGTKVILSFEGTGEGLHWYNLFSPASVDDKLSVGLILIMMLISSVIYILICLYLEQIHPGEYGVPQKWYFPFTSQFWCGPKEYSGINDSSVLIHRKNPEAFESEPMNKYVGIQIKNLKKTFGDKTAVKGLSMNMYEDEITVLLGHNGAGKTTTISMLTGMFPPTSGTAIINGCDIRTNINGARSSLSICPQHNVLFENLSVGNHIRFFSRLKGFTSARAEDEVKKYLKIIGLENKKNAASKELSGGMQRKLSICCALCGDTKVVLCDEPSSGMDPSARRHLWDLLQSEKKGRTILLTTHFMDEADLLGDRVAIMNDGDLQCHGTPFFLKKKFGSGYRLICVKREGCDSEKVTELLANYIPDIKPESDIGTELSYKLRDEYSTRFGEMLRELEESSDSLELEGYGVAITSLEDVFMKVGSDSTPNNGNHNDHDGYDNHYNNHNNHNNHNNQNHYNLHNHQQQEYNSNGVEKSSRTSYNLPPPSRYEDIESVDNELFCEKELFLVGGDLVKSQWFALFSKKFLYTIRNLILLIVQNVMPIFFIVITIIMSRTQGTSNALAPMEIGLEQYPSTVTVLEVGKNVTENSLASRVATAYKNITSSYGSTHEFESTGNTDFSTYILNLGSTLQVRINSKYLAAASIFEGSIIAWLNNQPLHTAPLTLNLIHNALARELIGPKSQITVTNSPLPFTTQTILDQLNKGNNMGTQLATNLCFCMCFVSAFYILFIIKERASTWKLLQFVGGINIWSFWLTQLVWDMITYIFTALIIICTLACFQEAGFASFVDLGRYFAVFLAFGLSALPLTYLISFLFTDAAGGFARITVFNVFAGMALFLVVTIMSIEEFDTKDVAKVLEYIFRIIPHFSLASSMNKLYANWATRRACNIGLRRLLPRVDLCATMPQCCNLDPYFGWKNFGVMPEMIYMLVSGVIYFLLLIVYEYGFLGQLLNKIYTSRIKAPPKHQPGELDEDVEHEKEVIKKMSAQELRAQNLVLDGVTKYYRRHLAVNQMSLRVKGAECFGLLGINGAGKTTTFKMLTGDESITFGSAYVKGMSLRTKMPKVYKEIGYCPQFHALQEDLTGRETLKVFCMIRGIPKNRIHRLSEKLAESFGFLKHIDKPTKNYSGGNKRKLNTALAIVGCPAVVYLDEPTSGMDPGARRQLWNMVCKIRDSGKSIVLTSHSMEECEALCTRLAIMVNGEFECIGSTQHLKNKFTKGLILKIKILKSEEIEDDTKNVKEFVESSFTEANLQDEYQGVLTFYIPLSKVQWSNIFGLMENSRERLKIEHYSISQTSLEEIFLDFAQKQHFDSRALK